MAKRSVKKKRYYEELRKKQREELLRKYREEQKEQYRNCGIDEGVEWFIEPKGDKIKIKAVKEGNVLEEVHTCEYPSIWGYDAMDIQYVNDKLDSMINKLKLI